MNDVQPLPCMPKRNRLFIIQLPQQMQLESNQAYQVSDSAIWRGDGSVTRLNPVAVGHKAIMRVCEGGAEVCDIAFSLRSEQTPTPALPQRRALKITPAARMDGRPASSFFDLAKKPTEASATQFPTQKFDSFTDFQESFGANEVKAEVDLIRDEFQRDTQPLTLPPEQNSVPDFYYDIMQYKFSAHLVHYLSGSQASWFKFQQQFEQEIGQLDNWQAKIAQLMRSAASRANFNSVVARVKK